MLSRRTGDTYLNNIVLPETELEERSLSYTVIFGKYLKKSPKLHFLKCLVELQVLLDHNKLNHKETGS